MLGEGEVCCTRVIYTVEKWTVWIKKKSHREFYILFER